jgi:single-strand DNA-binding protein
MYELNEVKLIGYAGKSPVTAAEGKKPFAAFDIGTTKRYTTKGDHAAVVVETHWHKVICYGKLADIAHKLVGKGSHVLICGALENTEWTDKEGQIHKGTRILANKIRLLDKKDAAQVADSEEE